MSKRLPWLAAALLVFCAPSPALPQGTPIDPLGLTRLKDFDLKLDDLVELASAASAPARRQAPRSSISRTLAAQSGHSRRCAWRAICSPTGSSPSWNADNWRRICRQTRGLMTCPPL